MPAILTHQAIMLLARDRVQDIRDRLARKKSNGLILTDLELRILHLATQAAAMLSDADDTLDMVPLPADPAAPPTPARAPVETPSQLDWPDGIGRGVSRFAVMGSMGPDIPGLAALLAPAQGVWFDIVHKGTPDSHREQLNARTTDVALEIWKQASQALTDRPTGGPPAARALNRARNQIRSYVLGHLTHLVGDIIAHPFINDVEWHVPRRQPPSNPFSAETFKFTHEKTEGSLDSRVAIEFFRRSGPRSGQPWSAWWPTVDEVPPELFLGYQRAMEEVHRISLGRPKGLVHFEEAIKSFTPPTPDADFFRDGYRALTKAGVGILYHWGYGSWLGFLSVAVLPLLATFPLAFAMPNGSKLFSQSIGDAGEHAAFEALTLPMALNAITPVVYGAVIASVTWRGIETIAGAGLVGASVVAMFGLVFFVQLLAGDPGAGFRWALLFALPAGIGLSLVTVALTKLSKPEKRQRMVLLLLAAPFLIAVVAGLLLMLFSEIIGMGSEQGGAISWGVLSGLIVLGGLLALFLLLPQRARDARVPEDAPVFPARRPHHVRLFDRSSLFTLTETHYPSGARPLLKLWWTGDGEFFIRAQRTHIEYRFAEDDSDRAKVRIVPAPITPMTQAQLADYLTNVVLDFANTRGKLKCALVHEDEREVEVPPGATFSDHGDVTESKTDDAPEFEQSAERGEFRKLTRENNDDSYVLFHAPKRAQAVRFDRRGPVPFDDREVQLVNGGGKISGSGTRITGVDTAFRFFFREGDHIVFNGQARVVTKILSDSALVIASAFRPAPDADEYKRLESTREEQLGYSFVAQPKSRSGFGDTIMDVAGDIGALFCLGGASRMLDGIEAKIPDLEGMVDVAGLAVPFPSLGPVARVFRNWSLDRRQVDEWREAVLGRATSDDGSGLETGLPMLLELGWVQTLRRWLQVVDRHGESAVDPAHPAAPPNEPSNLEISQAMARLLDMPQPIVVHRGP